MDNMSDVIINSREPWAWQDDFQPGWRWLTNAEGHNLEYIMRVEEMYGEDQTWVRKPAYDNNKKELPDHVAIFVTHMAYESRQLTNPHSPELPRF